MTATPKVTFDSYSNQAEAQNVVFTLDLSLLCTFNLAHDLGYHIHLKYEHLSHFSHNLLFQSRNKAVGSLLCIIQSFTNKIFTISATERSVIIAFSLPKIYII